MSHKVVNLVYSRIVGSAHRKAVLAYMADRASDGGEGVYCSKGTIADETEIARSTVFKLVKELVAEGILIEVGRRGCTNGHTVEYDMNLDRIRAFPEVKSNAGKSRDQSESRTGPQGDQSAQRTPPVRQPDPYQSASRTQTTLGTILEPEEPPLVPQPEPKRKRAIALPDNWVPSERNIADAQDRNFSAEEIQHEADRFRDYHLAHGTTFRDWDAGWRTWLGNARKFGSRSVARPAAPGGHGRGSSIASIVARRRAEGQV